MIIIRNAEAQGLCLERKKWGAAFGGAAPLCLLGVRGALWWIILPQSCVLHSYRCS